MNGDLHKTLRSKEKHKSKWKFRFAVQEQSFPWLYAGLVAAVLVLWLILLFCGSTRKKRRNNMMRWFRWNIDLIGRDYCKFAVLQLARASPSRYQSSGTITFYDLSPIPHPSGSVNGASKQQTQLPIYKESNQQAYSRRRMNKDPFSLFDHWYRIMASCVVVVMEKKGKEDEHVATNKFSFSLLLLLRFCLSIFIFHLRQKLLEQRLLPFLMIHTRMKISYLQMVDVVQSMAGSLSN